MESNENKVKLIGVQYHPEFKSQPGKPHPLYLGLIRAVLEYKNKRRK